MRRPQRGDFEFDTIVDWLVAPLLMTREMHIRIFAVAGESETQAVDVAQRSLPTSYHAST